jgi:hypothetical protein
MKTTVQSARENSRAPKARPVAKPAGSTPSERGMSSQKRKTGTGISRYFALKRPLAKQKRKTGTGISRYFALKRPLAKYKLVDVHLWRGNTFVTTGKYEHQVALESLKICTSTRP